VEKTPGPYPPDLLLRLCRLAEAEPEEEVCGFVVRRGNGALDVVPLRNVLGEEDAPGLPEDRRRGYLADPVGHLRLAKRLREEGGLLLAAYHSHVEADAYFSGVDREFALHGGGPLWPGLEYLVVSVRSGSARELRRFSWNGQHFEGSILSLPQRENAARHPP